MKNQKKTQMKELRQKIDDVDEKILTLLAKRGRFANRIGKIKESEGIEVYVPSRERQIFEHMKTINNGPYSDTALFAIYREIISATRALEQPTRVAFLGPIATFTHVAAVEHFGNSADFEAQKNIASVFDAVEKNHVDFGVVPIENSTEGVVNYTLDQFVGSDLKICSEVVIEISQNLLSIESEIKNIKTIYSHPHALAQCRKWLSLNLPHVQLKEVDSTALAAQMVSQKKQTAAIASNLAADLYGLNLLVSGIQDQTQNLTRFLVVGREQAKKTGDDKTSLVFVGKHKAGVLYDLLKPFSSNKVNLTKIESRPLKSRVWDYMFFVDMEGHLSERKIINSLKELEKHCETVKVLGSYPRAMQIQK